jgi:NADPH:quinone reductase-like Zn-dependent oxidoreductase
MKAVFQRKYGGPEVLQLEEATMPILKKDEVMIKVIATSVSSGDTIIRELKGNAFLKFMMRLMFGITKPRAKIPGLVAAGIISEIGSDVKEFKIGDEVYAITGMKGGCYAEYVKMKASKTIVHKPSYISFEEAAPIPFGAMTALHFLDSVDVSKGDKVLVYGASGSVGSYAVQLAKHFGAEVTAVCSTKNFDVVKGIGADHLIDYKLTDFSKSNTKYDIIFDAVGYLNKKVSKNNLFESGKYISIKTLTTETRDKLERLNKIIEEGKLKTIIDSTYTLEQISEAHKKVDSGHKVGNVIIKVVQ